jgi:hypothetical protein
MLKNLMELEEETRKNRQVIDVGCIVVMLEHCL